MKKIISLAVALIMVLAAFSGFAVMADDAQVSVWDGTVPEGDGGYIFEGRGTENKPYLIRSAEEFALFAANVRLDSADTCYKGKFFKLTVDIDLNNKEWVPIGGYSDKPHVATEQTYFAGTFDGDGHVIKNMKIKSTMPGTGDYEGQNVPANKCGLFGFICGATVKNIGIESGDIVYSGNKRVGALVGMGRYAYKIVNCFNKANMTITATDTHGDGLPNFFGAIVGWSQDNPGQNPDASMHEVFTDGKIIESTYNAGKITVNDNTKGTIHVGGIAGNHNSVSDLIDVWNTGEITVNYVNNAGHMYVGGLVGDLGGSSTFESIYSVTKITTTGTAPADNTHYGLLFGKCASDLIGEGAEYKVVDGSQVTTAWSAILSATETRDCLPTAQTADLELTLEHGSFMYDPASITVVPEETTAETKKKSETAADETEAVTTSADGTEATEEKGGCGSTVVGGVALVAIAALGTCIIKKKEN